MFLLRAYTVHSRIPVQSSSSRFSFRLRRRPVSGCRALQIGRRLLSRAPGGDAVWPNCPLAHTNYVPSGVSSTYTRTNYHPQSRVLFGSNSAVYNINAAGRAGKLLRRSSRYSNNTTYMIYHECPRSRTRDNNGQHFSFPSAPLSLRFHQISSDVLFSEISVIKFHNPPLKFFVMRLNP